MSACIGVVYTYGMILAAVILIVFCGPNTFFLHYLPRTHDRSTGIQLKVDGELYAVDPDDVLLNLIPPGSQVRRPTASLPQNMQPKSLRECAVDCAGYLTFHQ